MVTTRGHDHTVQAKSRQRATRKKLTTLSSPKSAGGRSPTKFHLQEKLADKKIGKKYFLVLFSARVRGNNYCDLLVGYELVEGMLCVH